MASESKATRLHYLDSARMILMLLGIPYHAALLFQQHVQWYSTVGVSSETLMAVAAFIHIFRMPAFFLVAGYLAAIVLDRYSPWRWLQRRWMMLLPPLLFGTLLLHPVQQLAGLMQRQEVGALAISRPLQSFQELTAGSGIGHMWFLLSLLALCTTTALLWGRLPRLRLPSLGGLGIILSVAAGTALFSGVVLALQQRAPAMTFPLHTTFGHAVENTLIALPSFALGLAMARDEGLASALTDIRLSLIGAIVAAGLIFAVFTPFLSGHIGYRMLSAGFALPMTMALLSICRRCLDRRSPYTAWFSKASFTIYLLHHPVIVVLGVVTASLTLPWLVHYVMIVLVTILATCGIYMVGRNIPYLGVALGAAPARRG